MKLLKQQILFLENHKNLEFIKVTLQNTEGSTYKKAGAIKIVAMDGSHSGMISGGCLEADIVSTAIKLNGDHHIQTFDTFADADRLLGTTTGCQGRLHLVFQKVEKPTLLNELKEKYEALNPDIHIIGAGPDIDPLKDLLDSTGWSCRFYTSESGRITERRAQGWPIHPVTQPAMDWILHRPQRTAVLLMSHSFPMDLDILAQLAQTRVKYVGILGPEKRRRQMLQDLESIYNKSQRDYRGTLIEGPMGIGGLGKGEMAIALSVCARLQQLFFGGTP